MNDPNLFLRIEGYARENFTTEILSFILQESSRARKAFLELLLCKHPRRKKMLAVFKDCEIKTQANYGASIPDLVITSKRNRAQKLLIEVKTGSPEGDGQVQKYVNLNAGYVAYLTPTDYPLPTIRKGRRKFLGRIEWREVYEIIEAAGRGNVVNDQFLRYMEAHHMNPQKPMTTKDLRFAAHAVEVFAKSEEIVARVRKEVQPEWEDAYDANAGGKRISNDSSSGDCHSWWYRPKSWQRKEGRFYLLIGTGFDHNRKQGLKFYVGIGSPRRPFGKRLESRRQICELINGHKWEAGPDGEEWYCCKYFELGTGDIEDIARKQVQNVRSALKDLRKQRIIELMSNSV